MISPYYFSVVSPTGMIKSLGKRTGGNEIVFDPEVTIYRKIQSMVAYDTRALVI